MKGRIEPVFQEGNDFAIEVRPARPMAPSDAQDGAPANGGSGTRARVGLVEEIAGPLTVCTLNGLHGTLQPNKHRGSHWWVVALNLPVQWSGDKCASLKRTFVKDLGRCPFP